MRLAFRVQMVRVPADPVVMSAPAGDQVALLVERWRRVTSASNYEELKSMAQEYASAAEARIGELEARLVAAEAG